jgi:hypothetical protein
LVLVSRITGEKQVISLEEINKNIERMLQE